MLGHGLIPKITLPTRIADISVRWLMLYFLIYPRTIFRLRQGSFTLEFRTISYAFLTFVQILKASPIHYSDVIMGAIASLITSLTIVYSTVYSDADQRKHQSSASQAFVWGIHRGPVNSPHKWPVTRKMFPFDDVIMNKRKYVKQNLNTGGAHDNMIRKLADNDVTS